MLAELRDEMAWSHPEVLPLVAAALKHAPVPRPGACEDSRRLSYTLTHGNGLEGESVGGRKRRRTESHSVYFGRQTDHHNSPKQQETDGARS